MTLSDGTERSEGVGVSFQSLLTATWSFERGKRIMNLQLNDKRALITGSTLGIGFAIAKALAQEGAQVTVNGRTEERVSEAKRRIATEIPNAKIAGVNADLSSSDGVSRIIDACPEIDILVNNVGIFEPRAFEQISDADWFRFFEVNVMSGVRLSRHYLPQLKDRNLGANCFYFE